MTTDKKLFVVLMSFKDFVEDLAAAYIEPEDLPLKISMEYLRIMSPFHRNCAKTVQKLTDFLVKNREVLEKKTLPLPEPSICFDEDAFIEISRFLEKKDDNQEIIYKHLKALDLLIRDEILSNEERVLNETISNLVASLPLDQMKIDDGATPETAVKTLIPSIIPSVEQNLELFKQRDIDQGRFAKLACLTVREHLMKKDTEIPGLKSGDKPKIKVDQLIELAEMLIEQEDLSGTDLTSTIIQKLSSSGLLANFPITDMFQMIQNIPQ